MSESSCTLAFVMHRMMLTCKQIITHSRSKIANCVERKQWLASLLYIKVQLIKTLRDSIVSCFFLNESAVLTVESLARNKLIKMYIWVLLADLKFCIPLFVCSSFASYV